MTHFPLNTAALCQDCSEVGDSLRRCACCGSRSLIALAPVLNREAPLGAYELEQPKITAACLMVRSVWVMRSTPG
jgi:hypothetical protein